MKKAYLDLINHKYHDMKHEIRALQQMDSSQRKERLQELEQARPFLKVLTKPNGGHGPTVLYGYHYAVSEGADYIFQTDSDGQTLPSEFERFWKLKETYDVVLGKRPGREDGAARVLVEKVLCVLLRLFFGVSVPDANAPYRLMKREVLENYLPMIPKDYHIPNVILTTFFSYYQEKLIFVRITFRSRQKGTNSINLQKIIRIGWRSLSDFRMFRKELSKKTQ